MNKKAVIGIIALITFALIGLVLLQVYWINSTIKLKEQEFSADVHEVLQEVVGEHQATITAELIENVIKVVDTNGVQLLIINQDTIEIPEGQNPNIFINPDARFYFRSPNDPSQPDDMAPPVFDPNMFFSDPGNMANMRGPEWIKMVEAIVTELSQIYVPLEKRVNVHLIDELLHRKLEKRGIDLGYDFGVLPPKKDTILTAKQDIDVYKLANTEYRLPLFHNRFLGSNYTLYVSFPQKLNYLLRTMWLRLLTSIFFILIIIFSFGFTIWTIFRQKKLSDMKNDFINNMTHEFKTPITTISLAGQALRDPDVVKDEQRLSRFSNIILDESGKLGMQVEKILQMAVLDKSSLELKIEKVNLHEVIAELTENYQLRLPPDAHFEINLNAGTPQIEGDEVHITNIIDNLLDNAVKYSGEKIDVRVRTSNFKDGVLVSIADKGIGMTREEQKRIFERFYRVPTGNVHDVKGFGLGLSYVKTMVEAHGGFVQVDSEIGTGTTFEVYFPFKYQEQNI